jgi:beta-N-acetylhexosaminidase
MPTMPTNASERAAARLLMIGFDGLEPTPEVEALIRRGVGGVILFARNFRDRAQVAGLCRRLKSLASGPLAIAVDHEGGRVQRFRGTGFTDTPPMRDLGSHPEGERRARAYGALFAAELRPLGIDIDFAPVLDVDSNPANPVIGERSFSRDAETVGRLGRALIEGLQSGGVAACGKHFPGHGDTSTDSHLELPRLTHGLERLRAVELVPFRSAVAAGVASIMTSHIVFSALDPTQPATMSPQVIDGLLRGELGYDGVVVSDDLEMKAIAAHFPMPEAAIQAIKAGCDLLLVCHDPRLQAATLDGLARAIADGTIPAERVASAHRRLDRLFASFVR